MPEREISRRAVTRAAAWSVPALALAVAAPAAAASTANVNVRVTGFCINNAIGPYSRGFSVAINPDAPTGVDLPIAAQFLLTSTALFLPGSLTAQGGEGVSVDYSVPGQALLTTTQDLSDFSTMIIGIASGNLLVGTSTTFTCELLTADSDSSDNKGTMVVSLGDFESSVCA